MKLSELEEVRQSQFSHISAELVKDNFNLTGGIPSLVFECRDIVLLRIKEAFNEKGFNALQAIQSQAIIDSDDADAFYTIFHLVSHDNTEIKQALIPASSRVCEMLGGRLPRDEFAVLTRAYSNLNFGPRRDFIFEVIASRSRALELKISLTTDILMLVRFNMQEISLWRKRKFFRIFR